MSFNIMKLLFVPVISVFIMISSVYLGYSSNIPVMVLTAILLYGSMVLDRKYKWLRYGQFLFLGAFHLSTQLNWCVLLYYILIIHLIHRKASLKETLPISVLLVLQYSLIRQVYMPPTSYNLLVTVFDFISSLVVVFSYHFVHRLEYEKSKLWKEKQFLTFHDVLTGLLNYDGYMNKVQELVEYRTPFQLVLLDINNFKSLNGKDISTANEILISMAKAIQLRFDEHLIGASRYAGDRFAILLTEQAVIDDEKFKFDAIGVKVCYSITCYPHEASTFQGLITMAEDRIFQMRRNVWLREQDELFRTEKMKMIGELAAGMAHEIRNPLTSIKGFIQLSKIQNYNIKPWYDVIMGEITRVGELTAEFLQFSKPHASNMKLESLSGCMIRVYSLCESEAASYGHTFSLDLPDQEIKANMDRDKIIQLLINLIRNAFQAMEKTGHVSFSLTEESRVAVIQVTDTGKGIPPSDLPQIFEPFYTTKEEGTGLGLSVCQKIVEDHGGRIMVDSEVGTGTTFTVRIPIVTEVD
ncbi:MULTISPECIES: ATP-binding protein [Paenibacillus]|uniref:histidine kinase n=1 Tax=Paenibacillus campinasensis TaxID=66347 RepID=A0A268EUN8_9BACL|nr:ATP-binding protein [Paenibacillus campinasensis]PAD76840.1 histidine kinase [Paenibacillus campinasensis]